MGCEYNHPGIGFAVHMTGDGALPLPLGYTFRQ
jgi:hypothetical protein